MRVRFPGQGAWFFFKVPECSRGLRRDCVPEAECLSVDEVAMAGGHEPGSFNKVP